MWGGGRGGGAQKALEPGLLLSKAGCPCQLPGAAIVEHHKRGGLMYGCQGRKGCWWDDLGDWD